MTDPVRLRLDGHVAVLTIHRPDIRNAISDDDVLAGLIGALSQVDRDSSVRVAIITGEGGVFSAGGNIKSIRSGVAARDGGLGARKFYREGIQRLAERFETMATPTIAAVNGPALGLGCDLACMCDVRIASEEAQFAMTFVKLGLVPGDGGAFLLSQIVGHARASLMVLTGDPIDARTALDYGLVAEVVPMDDLMARATSLARRIAQNAPHAVQLSRRLLRWEARRNLSDVLELSAAFQALSHLTEDHAEAVSALMDKRPAGFVGR